MMSAIKQTFFKQLEDYFEQQNNPSKQNVQAGNKHVFQACMDHLETSLNFEEKMVLMDYHQCYSKALTAAREGNLASSNFWLNKADELPNFTKPILQKTVDVNKIPAIAYHLYREGDFVQAIQLLKDTIKISGELAAEAGIDYMIWGQMEDYINIFRVYCTQKDQTTALQYAQSILLAAVHGQHSPDLLENVSPKILLQAEIDFISYATADILVRLLKFENFGMEDVVIQLFQPLWNINDWSKCPLPGYKNAVFALKYWTEKDEPALFKELEELLPNMAIQNPVLQFFVLETLIPSIQNLANAQGEQLLIGISNYYIEQLNLDFFILDTYAQLEFKSVVN